MPGGNVKPYTGASGRVNHCSEMPGTGGSNRRCQNASCQVTNCVCTEIGKLTLENDFLAEALSKAGLLGDTK